MLEIWGYVLCSRVTCLTSSYPSPSEKRRKAASVFFSSLCTCTMSLSHKIIDGYTTGSLYHRARVCIPA